MSTSKSARYTTTNVDDWLTITIPSPHSTPDGSSSSGHWTAVFIRAAETEIPAACVEDNSTCRGAEPETEDASKYLVSAEWKVWCIILIVSMFDWQPVCVQHDLLLRHGMASRAVG